MFGLGLWDDIKHLGAKRKLLGQILIATAVCSFGIGIQTFKIPFTDNIIHLGGWGGLITVLWLVGMTNLINLIDGVDGLAGGICLMLMTLLAFVGHQTGNLELVASGMAGALLGFLWFNFPPARIYMGDGGAYLLGFQIGLFTIVSSQKGTILPALVAPLFVLALPIVDTSLAILRRGLRGLPVFRPDRKHIHHRLMDMGFSRRKVVLSLYAITLVFLIMGFMAFMSRGHLVPALLGVAVLILILCAGGLRFSREWFAVGRVVGTSLNMRQEIQYALCLTQWLKMEGARRASIEGLWSDLVFVAQRLGFTAVKLTLADGERVWPNAEQPSAEHSNAECGMRNAEYSKPERGTANAEQSETDSAFRAPCSRTFRHVLQGGLCGILEVEAPSTPRDVGAVPASESEIEQDEAMLRACVSDAKLFEIISELLAEGWIKAARKWANGSHTALRFDAKVSAPRNGTPRRTLASAHGLPGMPQPGQPEAILAQ
jgi:UDP-N-acetylmuramyl pentapeptide phosphotransferase/UDP-N-acetylglucosamine-1-phosphate transferase